MIFDFEPHSARRPVRLLENGRESSCFLTLSLFMSQSKLFFLNGPMVVCDLIPEAVLPAVVSVGAAEAFLAVTVRQAVAVVGH